MESALMLTLPALLGQALEHALGALGATPYRMGCVSALVTRALEMMAASLGTGTVKSVWNALEDLS